jgi:hypothetical protein
MKNNFDIHKWQAKYLRESKEVREVTGAGLERLEGMIDRPLLRTFLETFDEMYNDLIDNGEEFEPGDLIEFLSYQMQEWARDSRMSATGPTSY